VTDDIFLISSLKTDNFGMLLKCVLISVHAPFLHECVHTTCNKSRRHNGHITGARTAFQTAHTYKHCYYNYSTSKAVSQIFVEIQPNMH